MRILPCFLVDNFSFVSVLGSMFFFFSLLQDNLHAIFFPGLLSCYSVFRIQRSRSGSRTVVSSEKRKCRVEEYIPSINIIRGELHKKETRQGTTCITREREREREEGRVRPKKSNDYFLALGQRSTKNGMHNRQKNKQCHIQRQGRERV